MKTKLIKTEKYLLLIDLNADIVGGNRYYDAHLDSIETCNIRNRVLNKKAAGHLIHKIIGQLPRGDSLKLEHIDSLPQLSNDAEDVENIARSEFKVRGYRNPSTSALSYFTEGYNAKVAKLDKNIINICRDALHKAELQHNKDYTGIWTNMLLYLQSLNTTKEPIGFKVEMTDTTIYDDNNKQQYKWISLPKVIDGIIQGKYIY